MDTPITLININTLGTTFFAPKLKERYEKIGEYLRRSGAEIVCLQEIGTYYNLSLIKKYTKDFPYCAYIPQLTGPKGALVILSKLPLGKAQYRKFETEGSLRNISFYTKILQNGVLYCRLQDLPLTIMNTHTVTDFEFQDSPTNKFYHLVRSQVLQAAELMREVARETSVILTGDFNMAKGTPLYKELLKRSSALDPFSEESSPTYHVERLDFKFKGKKSARIDFILLKQSKLKFASISTKCVFDSKVKLSDGTMSYLSDHSGLQISFSLH